MSGRAGAVGSKKLKQDCRHGMKQTISGTRLRPDLAVCIHAVRDHSAHHVYFTKAEPASGLQVTLPRVGAEAKAVSTTRPMGVATCMAGHGVA